MNLSRLFVPENLNLRMSRVHSIYVFLLNVPVQRAEVQHHGAAGLLLSKIRDVSAVVAHGCAGVQARCRKTRHGSAKAITDDPALLRRVFPQVSESSRPIRHGVCGIALPRQSDPFL